MHWTARANLAAHQAFHFSAGAGVEPSVCCLRVPASPPNRPCSDTAATNQSMDAVGALCRLDRLNLSFTAVNDGGLRCLRRLTGLRCLNLDSRHFTGGCTGALAQPQPCSSPFSCPAHQPAPPSPACMQTRPAVRFPRHARSTDRACAALPRRTDAGMASVARLTSLECLDLFGARVGDAGCASLRCAVLPGFRCRCGAAPFPPGPSSAALGASLLLPERRNTVAHTAADCDSCPIRRRQLPRLRRLELCSGGVTDAGVAQLAALTQLQHLSLAQARPGWVWGWCGGAACL